MPGIDGIVVSSRDVSERIALEQQFHQAQKMEAVGQLAGGIAHDFNNLLTAIAGYSELVLDSEELSAGLRSDVDEIRRAAGRAAGLTAQLLAFSRRQVLQPTVLSVNEVAIETYRMLEGVIGDAVRLVTRLDPELAAVSADAG